MINDFEYEIVDDVWFVIDKYTKIFVSDEDKHEAERKLSALLKVYVEDLKSKGGGFSENEFENLFPKRDRYD